MPHIIVEYSKNIGDIIDISSLIIEMHRGLAAQGIDKDRIKARGISCVCTSVGGHFSRGHMLHATLLLLEGRDSVTKKQYGDALHKLMHEHIDGVVKNCSITLEIRDMDKDYYYM